MQLLTTIQKMRLACKQARHAAGQDGTIGFVPTMGAIHQGHLSLVDAAARDCDIVAASIFVNPLQFGPAEDFADYPRSFDEDCEKLAAAGVDMLFAPETAEIYPAGATTFVEVPGLSERLDGASRPAHFRGVATVVTKLFHITQPDVAYFGQKDAAQVAVLEAMVRDLNFPVRMVVCPTVREADGLAMSSRNRYLSSEDRVLALALSRALQKAAECLKQGETNAFAIRNAMMKTLSGTAGLRVDYAEIVSADTLLPIDLVTADALIAVAAWVGETRLIDNLRAGPPSQE